MRIGNIPSHLDDYICASVDYCCTNKNYVIPKSYEEAVISPESPMWKTAMDSEIDSLIENNTFSRKPITENIKQVGGRWVYSVKVDQNNEDIFKARYVAKGYSQIYGKDYFETFAPHLPQLPK